MSRILFADGEPHIRQLCLEELQDEGYEVRVTGKAAEVVRLVDSFQARYGHHGGGPAGYVRGGDRHDGQGDQSPDPGGFLFPRLPSPDLSSWGADGFVVKSPNLDGLKAAVRRLMPA